MSDQNLSEQQLVQAVYALAAEQMKKGASRQQIESTLVEKGLDQKSAATVVSNLIEARSKAIRQAGQRNMAMGALWCIGGIIVTVLTYSAASSGGTYIVAWGAIIFGALQFLRGLLQSR